MSSFLYFLPGTQGKAEERLDALGFSHVMEYGAPSVSEQQGPAGLGFLITPASKSPADTVFVPERQTWKRFKGGDIWVGYQNDKPPTPQDLERKMLSPGYLLELQDGNTYRVSPAKLFPARECPNESGDGLERTVLSQYEEMSNAHDEFAGRCQAVGGVFEVPDLEQFEVASRVLGINYCVGPCEVGLLGLLTGELRGAVLVRFLDFKLYNEVAQELEKNADGEVPTPSGAGSTSGEEGC